MSKGELSPSNGPIAAVVLAENGSETVPVIVGILEVEISVGNKVGEVWEERNRGNREL